jgi:signal transduction histidine kinase
VVERDPIVQAKGSPQEPTELDNLIERVQRFQELGPIERKGVLDDVLLWLWLDQQTLASSLTPATPQEGASSQETTVLLYRRLGELVHRLNTPISFVRARCQLAEVRFGDVLARHPYFQEVLREIQEVASEVAEMIRQWKEELPGVVAQEVEVNALVDSAIASFVVPDTVRVELKLAEKPLVAVASHTLQSVFASIITNAVEAMPDGGTLTVETSQHNGHIEVRVKDTGQGIPSEWLEGVFQGAFSTKGEGRGLGLWFSRLYMEQLGGTIEVKSEVGQGTEFIVSLPIERAEV